MRWSVGQQLQVVGRVLVVRGHVEGHETVEELLTGRVVAEECVSVDMVTAGEGVGSNVRRRREGGGERGIGGEGGGREGGRGE